MIDSKDDTRLRVMRLIEKEPLLTQRELARRLGVSLGGINYCIRALIDKGWVKADNFRKNEVLKSGMLRI